MLSLDSGDARRFLFSILGSGDGRVIGNEQATSNGAWLHPSAVTDDDALRPGSQTDPEGAIQVRYVPLEGASILHAGFFEVASSLVIAAVAVVVTVAGEPLFFIFISVEFVSRCVPANRLRVLVQQVGGSSMYQCYTSSFADPCTIETLSTGSRRTSIVLHRSLSLFPRRLPSSNSPTIQPPNNPNTTPLAVHAPSLRCGRLRWCCVGRRCAATALRVVEGF